MEKNYYCKDCAAFKNGNYCEVYDTNTLPDAVACSKYKAKEIEPVVKPPSMEHVHSSEEGESTMELPINNSRGIFSGPFKPVGRIRRLEYGISLIIYFGGMFCINYGIKSDPSVDFIDLILYIIKAAFWVWYLYQSIKRCHDMGLSGWLVLVPLFNPFALLFISGDEGINKYGSDPKQDYDDQLKNDPIYRVNFDSETSNSEDVKNPKETNFSKGTSTTEKNNDVELPDTTKESSLNPRDTEDPEHPNNSLKNALLIFGVIILIIILTVLSFKISDHRQENRTSVSSLYNDSSFQTNSDSITAEAGNHKIDNSKLAEGEVTDGIIIFTPPEYFEVEKEVDDSTGSYTYHLSSSDDDIYVLGDYSVSFTKDDFEQICNVWEDNSVKDIKGIKRTVTVDKQYAKDNGNKVFQRQVTYRGNGTGYWDIYVVFNPVDIKIALISEYRIGGKPHINEIANSIKFR